MSEAIPPFPQYALMAWCLVKAPGQLYLLPLPYMESMFLPVKNHKDFNPGLTVDRENVLEIKILHI